MYMGWLDILVFFISFFVFGVGFVGLELSVCFVYSFFFVDDRVVCVRVLYVCWDRS